MSTFIRELRSVFEARKYCLVQQILQSQYLDRATLLFYDVSFRHSRAVKAFFSYPRLFKIDAALMDKCEFFRQEFLLLPPELKFLGLCTSWKVVKANLFSRKTFKDSLYLYQTLCSVI